MEGKKKKKARYKKEEANWNRENALNFKQKWRLK